jgi:hypothetical protein
MKPNNEYYFDLVSTEVDDLVRAVMVGINILPTIDNKAIFSRVSLDFKADFIPEMWISTFVYDEILSVEPSEYSDLPIELTYKNIVFLINASNLSINCKKCHTVLVSCSKDYSEEQQNMLLVLKNEQVSKCNNCRK